MFITSFSHIECNLILKNPPLWLPTNIRDAGGRVYILMVRAVIDTRAGSVPGNKQGRYCPCRKRSWVQKVAVGQDPDPPGADPQHPSKRSRADLGTVAQVSRAFRWPGQLMATRQGQGQAGKPSQHSKARLNVIQD